MCLHDDGWSEGVYYLCELCGVRNVLYHVGSLVAPLVVDGLCEGLSGAPRIGPRDKWKVRAREGKSTDCWQMLAE